MKKMFLVLITLIIVGMFIPAVSADEIYNRTFAEIVSTTIESPNIGTYSGRSVPGIYISDVNAIATKTTLRQVEADLLDNQIYGTAATLPTYHWDNVPLNIDGNTVGYADLGFFKFVDGTTSKTRLYAYVHELDVSGYTGSQKVYFNLGGYEHSDFQVVTGIGGDVSGLKIRFCAVGTSVSQHRGWAILWDSWENTVIVDNSSQNDIEFYSIDVKRNIDGKSNPSVCRLYTTTLGYYLDTNYPNSGTNDIHFDHLQSNFFPMNVSIQNLITGTWHNDTISLGSFVDPTPVETTVTVYVRNSQTGALLANAHLTISANVNGNFYEVVNETAPSGIYSIDLQPTGGGMPNPDFYRLIVTAEGYNSIMPHIDFEVDGATSIYAYLDPVAGAPEDENKTFIDFYVRDLAANTISGATVNFGGYTLITNSAGYTMFEVYKNQTYSWTVSKSGYGSVTGNAVIGSNARHTINSVIAPAVTPTTPTPIPTSTSISPTPTMTAPNGEPTSNLLEWFAAHFGMILGGGVEIGKIFMWLCFALPVGVYVGKEAKAGAAGFMAGAGVVTLFFVLIGWVPIWLLVFLALIIGLLYAKVFNNSDTGGGR